MGILLTKFNYTNSYQDTVEITDSTIVTVSLGSEGKNNKGTIILKNPVVNTFSDGSLMYKWVDKTGTIIFKAVKASKGQVIDDEIIEIYAHYSDSDPTIDVQSDDYLLFSGIINKGKVSYQKDSQPIELTFLDRNQIILDKITIPTSIKEADSKNAPLCVQQIIRSNCENQKYNSYGYSGDGVKSLGYPFLIDARLFSENIKTSGTVTSVSSRKLVDTGGTFSTVEKGDWVRNTTSNQTAYVLSIDSSTELSLSKNIFTSVAGYEISDGFIQDFRTDGTSFPDIAFSNINKPLAENIDKISQIENTNTAEERDETSGTLIMRRGMRWFIDKKNRFHWYYPTDTPDYYINIGQVSAISPDTSIHYVYVGVDLNNEIRNNVNFIIFKAGEDMNHQMIKSYARAKFSGVPMTKDSLRIWLHIANDMKQGELQAGNITKGTATTDDYSYPSFPLIPTWDSQGRNIGTASVYNAYFKEEAIIRGRAKSNSEFQKFSNPRWAGQIPIRGEDIIPGDLVNLTSSPHGIKDIKVRVTDVSHIISTEQGWQTVLTVEEDELEQQIG